MTDYKKGATPVDRANGEVLISVVICTYNRADLLRGVLQSLCTQILESSRYEVVVVDNNSTDGTCAVAREFRLRYPNVSHYVEQQQGLSHARNLGLEVARGEFVAYIDDDARVPERYLAVAEEVIQCLGPAVFGGPYFAFYNSSSKPRWFKDAYGSHFQGEEARILGPNEFLHGGNFIIRRSLAQKLGGFNPTLGMSGRRIAYGEETALIQAMRASMPEEIIYYEPRLYVYHLVSPWKMTIRGAMRQRFADGRYSYRVFRGDHAQVRRKFLLLLETLGALIVFCADFAWALVGRNRCRYPYVQNYLYEHSLRYIRILGGCYEQWRQQMTGSRMRVRVK